MGDQTVRRSDGTRTKPSTSTLLVVVVGLDQEEWVME